MAERGVAVLATRRLVLWAALAVLFPGLSADFASAETWSQSSAAFRAAEGRRDWDFPTDHGLHPGYRLEWWYVTGLLTTKAGERLGFQVTFFRRGLLPERPERGSAWAAQSLYAAQAALTRPGEKHFLHEGRAGRDGLGLAGSEPERLGVWVGSWQASAAPTGPHDVDIAIPAEGFQLDLKLRTAGAPVLHGERGLDRKGSARSAASWYYSLPRMAVEGRVRIDGAELAVTGEAWMDHEFGGSQLGEDQIGWDWFGLRLDDGSALMLYRLRGAGGSVDPHSGGTYILPDGTSERLAINTATGPRLEPVRHWTSPATGAKYPLAWTIEWPARGLSLRVAPLLDGQELMPTAGIPFPYWEGAMSVDGAARGRAIRGEGYLELTGYAGELAPMLR